MSFFCELINELSQPKSLIEFVIASLSGFLGAGAGVYFGQKQADKVKAKQDQLLREILLKNCLAVTNSNRTLLKNDGIDFNASLISNISELKGQMVRLVHGLTTESYFALMDTGLQQVLDNKFQDAILYVRALIVQLRAKISGCHTTIIDYDDQIRGLGQQEWRRFDSEMKETHKKLLDLREKIKTYLLAHGWKEEEME